MAAGNGDWTADVTVALQQRLMAAASECVVNCNRLLEDARLLRRDGRLPTATAIAILAQEEAGKAIILHQAAFQRRWDSVLHKSLIFHADKQGVSEGFNTLNVVIRSMDEDQLMGIFRSPHAAVSGICEVIAPAIEAGRKASKSRVLDKLKQDSLYVAVDREARITSSPIRNAATVGTVADEMITLAETALSVCAAYNDTEGWAMATSIVNASGLFRT